MNSKYSTACSSARPCIRIGVWQIVTFFCFVIYSIAGTANPSIEGGATLVYQTVGQRTIDAEWTISVDLVAKWSTNGGEWMVYAEGSSAPDSGGVSATFPTANADAGSVLNRDGDGGIQISEFNYTFFLSTNKTLTFGLIDPSAWLDQSHIANDENTEFLNGSFSHNATIEFPDYTLGGVLRWSAREQGPSLTVAVGGSDGIADLPDRSYQSLLNLTSDERGLFIGSEVEWTRENFAYRFGGWWRSDDHNVLGVPAAPAEDNYGGYGVLDWSKDIHSVSVRTGISKKDVSVVTGFLALAYELEIDHGVLGFGISKSEVANVFRQRELTDTWGAEVFYNFPIASGRGHVTPSIQHVENPGFDGTGIGVPKKATVFGLRVHWPF